MNEAQFSAAYLRRWKKAHPGSIYHRIPDGRGEALPTGGMKSLGKRPFDHFGILAPGQPIAWEFKFMNGGATFIVATQFKGRMHQLYRLREWAAAGGIGMVVLGWIPSKERRSITFEFPISELEDDSRIPLTRPAR